MSPHNTSPDHREPSRGPPPSYSAFKSYLSNHGFTIYPTEFVCYPSEHPLVDIAAKMGGYFWAFEYKSENDSISRGVNQLRAYSEWFDLVVLVSERELDHSKSLNYWKLRSLGAGLWNFDRVRSGRVVAKSHPLLQTPNLKNKKIVSRRFRAFERWRKLLDDMGWRQTRLSDFFTCG